MRALQGCQALANRVFGKFGHAPDVQLFHDVLAMGFDRLYAQVEGECNFLCGVPFGDELEHFALSCSQDGDGGFLVGLNQVLKIIVPNDGHDLGAEAQYPRPRAMGLGERLRETLCSFAR